MKRWGAIHTREWLFVSLLTLAVLFSAYQFPYTYSIDLGREEAAPFLLNFYGAEQGQPSSFRWSAENSIIIFPAPAQNQEYQLRLRLAASPRPEDAPPPDVTLTANGTRLQTFRVSSEWSGYRLLLEPQQFAGQPDLRMQIGVAPFVPNQSYPDNSDDRELGVRVNQVTLQPVGRPVGWVVLPPLNQALGWVIAAWLAFALILQIRFARSERIRLAILFLSELTLGAGLVVARPWVVQFAWPVCLTLAVALVGYNLRQFVVRRLPSPGAAVELAATGGISFEFLHTLGIRNPRLRSWVEVALIAAIVAYYFSAVLLPLREGQFWDLKVYYSASVLILQGVDFYDPEQVGRIAPDLVGVKGNVAVFTYPPSGALLIAPLALLPLSEVKWWWLLGRFASLVGAGILLVLAVRKSVPRPPSPIWLVLLFATSQSVYDALYWGNASAFFPFFFALGLWGWTNRRATATGAAIVLATALKIAPGIYLVYFLLKRSWRALIMSILIGAALFLLSLRTLGFQVWSDYIFSELPGDAVPNWSPSEQGLVQLLRRINSITHILPDERGQPPAPEIRVVELVITIGLLFFTVWWVRRYSNLDALHSQIEFGAVLAVMLLIAPRIWIHYLMWLLLPGYLCLTLLVNRRMPVRAQAALAGLLAAGLLLSQYLVVLARQPDWPVALIPLGWYGTCLIYLCVLYALTETPVAPKLNPHKM